MPAALFDFDKTLLHGESLSLFLRFVARRYRRSLVDFPRLGLWMAPYAAGAVSKASMKSKALRILRHVPFAKRPELVSDFVDEVLLPRIYKAGLERVGWHRDQGHTLVLASASVDTYMEPVRSALRFDILAATRTQADGPNGVPQVAGANCYGEEKVRRMAELDFFENTDWAGSYAYSDHPSDLPMFLLCGHPVAVNPNRSLRKMARREGWEILDWA